MWSATGLCGEAAAQSFLKLLRIICNLLLDDGSKSPEIIPKWAFQIFEGDSSLLDWEKMGNELVFNMDLLADAYVYGRDKTTGSGSGSGASSVSHTQAQSSGVDFAIKQNLVPILIVHIKRMSESQNVVQGPQDALHTRACQLVAAVQSDLLRHVSAAEGSHSQAGKGPSPPPVFDGRLGSRGSSYVSLARRRNAEVPIPGVKSTVAPTGGSVHVNFPPPQSKEVMEDQELVCLDLLFLLASVVHDPRTYVKCLESVLAFKGALVAEARACRGWSRSIILRERVIHTQTMLHWACPTECTELLTEVNDAALAAAAAIDASPAQRAMMWSLRGTGRDWAMDQNMVLNLGMPTWGPPPPGPPSYFSTLMRKTTASMTENVSGGGALRGGWRQFGAFSFSAWQVAQGGPHGDDAAAAGKMVSTDDVLTLIQDVQCCHVDSPFSLLSLKGSAAQGAIPLSTHST